MRREFVKTERGRVWHLPNDKGTSLRCHRNRNRFDGVTKGPEKYSEVIFTDKIPYPLCVNCLDMMPVPYREKRFKVF